jgi:hypothetical protein
LLVDGGIEVCLVGLISRSSWELVELLELSTGETEKSPLPMMAFKGTGYRPADIMFDDRFAYGKPATSLPFTDELETSTALWFISPPCGGQPGGMLL